MILTTVIVVLCLGNINAEQYIRDEYIYWTDDTVRPELFIIDKENELIVLAATNSLCHLSMTLEDIINVQQTTPNQTEIEVCLYHDALFQPQERCKNFHHVLLFPRGMNDSENIPGTQTPIQDTVLICGSNAYQPKCTYRHRTNLSSVMFFNGGLFCPYDQESVTASIISSEGHLVSATSLDVSASKYGITLSRSPFNGETSVRTIEKTQMFRDSTFVDIYEIGQYYYVFMSELAVEITTDIIYSRVGRICKDDRGVNDILTGEVFTTFLKARMACTSQEYEDEIEYYYDNLKDTVYLENGTVHSSVSGEHLYGIFTSPTNSPAGSVLCVYTFDGRDKDLMDIFSENYLKQISLDNWESSINQEEVTCGVERTLADAKSLFLMEPVATQAGDPLVRMDGVMFQRLVVDQVKGVDGDWYEVLLIAATEKDNLIFLKITYVPRRYDNKVYISQKVSLTRNSTNGMNQTISNMELYKNQNNAIIYMSTQDGLYAVSISDCSQHKDCRSCLEARDPYCAYDISINECVSILSRSSEDLIQDVVNGSAQNCPAISTTPMPMPTSVASSVMETVTSTNFVCSPSVVLSVTTATKTITRVVISTPIISSNPTTTTLSTFYTSSSEQRSTSIISTSIDRSERPIVTEPTTVGATTTQTSEDYTWTVVAGCGGLIIGIAIGLVLFALIRNRNKFIWYKLCSRRSRYNFDDKTEEPYEMGRVNNEKPVESKSKRNNYVEYDKVPPRPSTPPLTKLNPSSQPGKVTDSPVLTKYSKTGKTHNRSMSSGGQFPPMVGITGYEPSPFHSPVHETPMRGNIRQTFHVEETISNNDRQKYGKNMVSKQLSREYPIMDTNSHHAKSGSLDLGDSWKQNSMS